MPAAFHAKVILTGIGRGLGRGWLRVLIVGLVMFFWMNGSNAAKDSDLRKAEFASDTISSRE